MVEALKLLTYNGNSGIKWEKKKSLESSKNHRITKWLRSKGTSRGHLLQSPFSNRTKTSKDTSMASASMERE